MSENNELPQVVFKPTTLLSRQYCATELTGQISKRLYLTMSYKPKQGTAELNTRKLTLISYHCIYELSVGPGQGCYHQWDELLLTLTASTREVRNARYCTLVAAIQSELASVG